MDDHLKIVREILFEAADKAFADIALGSLISGGVQTTTIAQPPPTLTIEKLNEMMRETQKISRNMRRNEMHVDVIAGHIGPMTRVTHPTDGHFFEMSYEQATELNARHPLRLVEVISTDRARFRFVHQFDNHFLPLFAPPYEVRETDQT